MEPEKEGNERMKWFYKYIPEDTKIKAFNQDLELKLLNIYHDCEKDADEFLKKIVKEKFKEELKKTGYKNLALCLPSRIKWKSLNDEKQNDLENIYRESMVKGLTNKTIKDRFKKYLSEGKPLKTKKEIPLVVTEEEISSKKEQLVLDWIDEKINEKGYISKNEDFENFKKQLGYSNRSFSNKMKESGLKFVNKRWVKP